MPPGPQHRYYAGRTLEAVAVVVEQTPNIRGSTQLTPGELREAISTSRAFLVLATQRELMAEALARHWPTGEPNVQSPC